MNRKDLRDFAVKMLYEMDIHKSFCRENVKNFINNHEIHTKDSYLLDVADQFLQHKEGIDDLIEKNSKSWALNRIAKIDLSILRVSFTEILYLNDIPAQVSVNEAVELAKKYGDEKSYQFINGILGNLLRVREYEDKDLHSQ
ncbi:MAG: transcription antitermination factor NusB [Peptostreptococcaceae bacterium]|nr:transcription antitermination factor NusB [Peptostreptococcaceae bacterium]